MLARILAAVAIATLAQPMPAAAGTIKDSIQTQQQRIRETQQRLQHEKGALDAARVREADLQRQLAETSESIAEVRDSLDDLSTQVKHNRTKLAWNTIQLDAAQATLDRHNEVLRRRLIDAYEHGDLGYLNVLLSSTSFSDFVERWDDIRYLIDANQQAIRERRSAEESVAAVQRSLDGAENSLETSLNRQQQARYQLDALAQTRAGLLTEAQSQRQDVAAEVTHLEELSAQEEAALERLIVERQREEAARREAERRAALLAGRAAPPAPSTGEFSWPVSGPITSPFGYRSDPYGGGGTEFHPGLDIGAPMGATVTAAAGGTVIYAAAYGGYGNAVIIDHGNGVSSLYGHLSQIFVAEHQEVQRGQAIGAVGMTGRATGPHLHFEVRVNGQPVDPASRLR
jgi:murein DD-endopeptidase MepM/ murein hydrolase activator NlpD